MAKFNIEVELDWMYEDNVDEAVKQEVISTLKQEVFKKIEEDIEKEIKQLVSENIEKTINKKLIDYMDNFMNEEFEEIDRWGDAKEVVTPKEKLKSMLDNFLKAKVDSRGRLDSYGNETRLNFVLDETAKKHIKQYQSGISEQVLEGIKEDINKETQERVVKSILSDYDLKKLIGKV